MILTVTLNPAWDLTWPVERLEVGGTNRVGASGGRAGGKGVNVSRVLQQMEHATLVTGVVGGAVGERLVADLAAQSLPHELLEAELETRSTLTIREADGRATTFNERGPDGPPGLWDAWLAHLEALLPRAELVVCSGSLPPWAPTDAYAVITRRTHDHGLRCLVDADGAALHEALPAGPDLVKPNEQELLRATGASDVRRAAESARALGARRVVVSRGPEGLLALESDESWSARPPALTPVNPTGAGDAAVAALAVGLLAGEAWPALLRRAVAWSAAAVLHPQAGTLDLFEVEDLADRTLVTRTS